MLERTIAVAASYLHRLDKSGEVANWAVHNLDSVRSMIDGYNELVAVFNVVSADAELMEQMPRVKHIKEIIGGNALPFLEEMAPGNFGYGLMDARKPMLMGQKIKNHEITDPSPEERAYAIGTPSMDTAVDALATGTIGHLAERTFFHWAKWGFGMVE